MIEYSDFLCIAVFRTAQKILPAGKTSVIGDEILLWSDRTDL